MDQRQGRKQRPSVPISHGFTTSDRAHGFFKQTNLDMCLGQLSADGSPISQVILDQTAYDLTFLTRVALPFPLPTSHDDDEGRTLQCKI